MVKLGLSIITALFAFPSTSNITLEYYADQQRASYYDQNVIV